MKNTQQTLDLSPRTKLRLSEIERLIKKHRIIIPTPSRRKLIELCEDGTFEHVPRKVAREAYLVYEDTFLRWVRELDATE